MKGGFVISVNRFVLWTGSLGLIEVVGYLAQH